MLSVGRLFNCNETRRDACVFHKVCQIPVSLFVIVKGTLSSIQIQNIDLVMGILLHTNVSYRTRKEKQMHNNINTVEITIWNNKGNSLFSTRSWPECGHLECIRFNGLALP